jgi:hypothetical protein
MIGKLIVESIVTWSGEGVGLDILLTGIAKRQIKGTEDLWLLSPTLTLKVVGS